MSSSAIDVFATYQLPDGGHDASDADGRSWRLLSTTLDATKRFVVLEFPAATGAAHCRRCFEEVPCPLVTVPADDDTFGTLRARLIAPVVCQRCVEQGEPAPAPVLPPVVAAPVEIPYSELDVADTGMATPASSKVQVGMWQDVTVSIKIGKLRRPPTKVSSAAPPPLLPPTADNEVAMQLKLPLHDNVVRLYGYSPDPPDGRLWFVLQHSVGGSLDSFIKRQRGVSVRGVECCQQRL